MGLRVRRRTRGQAMLVAVIGLVILAIGMYTSYNLSRAVYEKIQLQNAADAAAYSLATFEARALNFVAFVNRAQAANYVQMMEAQSMLSHMTALEGTAGYGGDLGQCIGRALGEAGVALVGLGQGVAAAHDAFSAAVDAMETTVPGYITMMTAKSEAMFAVAALYLMGTSAQVASSGLDIAQANDPDAVLPVALQVTLGALNELSFLSAIDWRAVGGFLGTGSSADADDARRLMTEIANASRFGSTLGSANADFVVARGLFSLLDGVVGELSGQSGSGNVGTAIQKLTDFLLGPYEGATKLLQVPGDDRGDLAELHESQARHSDLAMAQAIVASDNWFYPEGFFSVQSGVNESMHCRYNKQDAETSGLLSAGYGCAQILPGYAGQVQAALRALRLVITPGSYGFSQNNCKAAGEDDHRWYGFLRGGLAPYFPFASKISGISAEQSSFNQPDVWILLNKPSQAMALGGPGDLNFDLPQGQYRASLDARIGEEGLVQSGVLRGMNAIARAQVYYHRPGAWQEPPNLFNPFWGARLAPKNVIFRRIAHELGLSDALGGLAADSLWMH